MIYRKSMWKKEFTNRLVKREIYDAIMEILLLEDFTPSQINSIERVI